MSEQIRIPRGIRRLLAVTVMVVMAFAVFAQNAAALTQTIAPLDVTLTGTISNACNFPLAVTAHLTGIKIKLFDNGVLVEKLFQVTEQDSISANVVTLTTDPYNYSLQFDFQNGVLTSDVAYGVAVMLPLPDGTVFVSAGVIDFFAQDVDASITPDPGVTGDLTALCAAFSG